MHWPRSQGNCRATERCGTSLPRSLMWYSTADQRQDDFPTSSTCSTCSYRSKSSSSSVCEFSTKRHKSSYLHDLDCGNHRGQRVHSLGTDRRTSAREGLPTCGLGTHGRFTTERGRASP